MDEKPKKTHHKSKSGVKAKKKKEKNGKVERHNPRAFTFSGGVNSMGRRVQQAQEKIAKREKMPMIDKTPDTPAPLVVVVHGPPGVGKSTLIRSLAKHYTKQNLTNTDGPITMVSSKSRRLTFIESNNDVRTMLDLAKVADLVLLVVDASYGFEMETFEMLNIMQVHGFPRVLGVLTHLDKFSENKLVRRVKKTMKQRFWTEIYEGAKLFYLSGLQYGRYNKVEIANLSRFIAVQKFQPLSWRAAHPYMMSHRFEDMTAPHLPKEIDRTVNFYGYLSGARLRVGMDVHIPGVGDFPISAISEYTDPCPPPQATEQNHHKFHEHSIQGRQKNAALRTLQDRHKILYAPACNIGNVLIDADAMYINVPDYKVSFSTKDQAIKGPKDEDSDSDEEKGNISDLEKDADANLPEVVGMVRTLQNAHNSLGSTMDKASLNLIGNTKIDSRVRRRVPVGGLAAMAEDSDANEDLKFAEDLDDDCSESDAEEDEEEEQGEEEDVEGAYDLENDGDGEEGEDEDEEDDEEQDEDENSDGSDDEVDTEMIERAAARFNSGPSLEDLVYNRRSAPKEAKAEKLNDGKMHLFEEDDEEEAMLDENAPLGQAEKAISNEVESSKVRILKSDTDLFSFDGKYLHVPTRDDVREYFDEAAIDALKARCFITGGWDSADEEEPAPPKAEGEEGEEEDVIKPVVKAGKQALPTMDGSFAIASFIRVTIAGLPAECVSMFSPKKPVILGGLLPGENANGYMQLRVKKHRWAPKILKSSDAMLVSVGWRRFQSMPIFAIEDRAKRVRMLKYTPEHMHCLANLYGPTIPPSTGVLFIRNWDNIRSFRISATGLVLEAAESFKILKKLKLVGEPYKVFKNTTFVKNMFSSDLEVSKCLQSKIQTVSGIRGEIKKPIGTNGNFRASFEDKLLMSDLVMLKAWIQVNAKPFYNQMIDVPNWRRMKTIAALRHERLNPAPEKKDSEYGKKPERVLRNFGKLEVPKNLMKSLPFDIKNQVHHKKKRDDVTRASNVVRSSEEVTINKLLHKLQEVRKAKLSAKKDKNVARKAKIAKAESVIQAKRDAVTQMKKKKRHMGEGQKQDSHRKKMRLD